MNKDRREEIRRKLLQWIALIPEAHGVAVSKNGSLHVIVAKSNDKVKAAVKLLVDEKVPEFTGKIELIVYPMKGTK